jgi:hypothetical protein
MGSNGNSTGDTGGKTEAKSGASKWDAVITLIVVSALVGVIVFLVEKYGTDTEKIAAVLGVAAPVLAAAFGVSIGYYTGTKKGEAEGKEKGKSDMTSTLRPLVDTLEQHTTKTILNSITGTLEKPAGSAAYVLQAGATGPETEIPQESVRASREAVAELRGIVNVS